MYAEALRSALIGVVERWTSKEERVAVAYSGGLDSSIIEALARSVTATACYTCSAEGAFDHKHAPKWAKENGCLTTLLLLTPGELPKYVAEAGEILGASGPVEIAFTAPLLKVLDSCDEKVVLAGNGADELFGGYAKYLDMAEVSEMMARDLRKAQHESRLIQSAALSKGKELLLPYLSQEVIELAAEMPIGEKIREGKRKVVLYDVAKLMNLGCHGRSKKACQYSSGVMKEMERLARNSGMSVSDWTSQVVSGRRRIP